MFFLPPKKRRSPFFHIAKAAGLLRPMAVLYPNRSNGAQSKADGSTKPVLPLAVSQQMELHLGLKVFQCLQTGVILLGSFIIIGRHLKQMFNILPAV